MILCINIDYICVQFPFHDITLTCLFSENCPAQSCPGEGFVGKDCSCKCPTNNPNNPVQNCTGTAVVTTTAGSVSTIRTTTPREGNGLLRENLKLYSKSTFSQITRQQLHLVQVRTVLRFYNFRINDVLKSLHNLILHVCIFYIITVNINRLSIV